MAPCSWRALCSQRCNHMTRWFEDIGIDEPFPLGSHSFTEAEIIRFATLYDPQYFHIDPEAAKNRDLDKIAAISLSYTFFASKRTEKPLAAAKDIVAQPAPKL